MTKDVKTHGSVMESVTKNVKQRLAVLMGRIVG